SPSEISCPVLVVKREILNKGFHRDLVTTLDLKDFSEQVNSCRILLQENLPSGLFLDPYQLSSLRQHNLTEVQLLTPSDVEAPEYLSTGQTALVYTKPDPAACAHCYRSTVPIHLRYHRPSADSHDVSFTLREPQLLIHCNKDSPPNGCSHFPVVEASCGLDVETACRWLHLPYTAVPGTVMLQVPVGISQHTPVVCIVTIAVTLICTGMILTAVYKHDLNLLKPGYIKRKAVTDVAPVKLVTPSKTFDSYQKPHAVGSGGTIIITGAAAATGPVTPGARLPC
ncbi:GPI alpha-1,4-mannosyltransferase I, stabilizing subunit, partial [Pelodytes ibericus]